MKEIDFLHELFVLKGIEEELDVLNENKLKFEEINSSPAFC